MGSEVRYGFCNCLNRNSRDGGGGVGGGGGQGKDTIVGSLKETSYQSSLQFKRLKGAKEVMTAIKMSSLLRCFCRKDQ